MEMDLSQQLCLPSSTHLLGCDALGQDLLSRVISGGAHTLGLALLAVFLSGTLGLFMGILTCATPAPVERGLLKVIDVFLAFPGLLLAILMASLLPPTSFSVLFCLVFSGWAGQARLIRTLFKQVWSMQFIEAASAIGASVPRLLAREVWPTLSTPLLVLWTSSLSSMILAEASLSFLGLGGPLGQNSWGALIAEGRDYLMEAPHFSLAPGLALVLCVLVLQTLSQALGVCHHSRRG